MKYRQDKYGNKLSALGFGCLRLPGAKGRIDMAETEREILLAVNEGVNFFDTAYIYPGSEAAIGEIFEKHGLRDKVYIATKLPHYLIKSREGLEKLFNEQLKRLRTNRVDYYLMHMLTDIGAWSRLKELGIEEWIAEKKASGAIGQIGFSYHGNSDMFCKIIDAYDWEFCLIQYNYMDEHSQAGRKGLLHASSKGMPVFIMEPLRGGKLVSHLPDEAKHIFEDYPISRTPAQWAFRWLFNQPQVTVVLSGMNSEEMIRDNIKTASEADIGDLGADEEKMFDAVKNAINSKMKVGCTACGYCMPCPKNVDIPGTFAAYNRVFTESKFRGLKDYLMCTVFRKTSTAASNCIGCGKCEAHCPQNIEIRKEIKNVQKELEGLPYKVVSKLAKWFVRF
ncbi:MAG: aldo/keto reductase [Clostridia bacterium]|nr:aldo/keto reductase [Clostridia bacterium]